MREREADVVQAVEEPVAGEVVYVEGLFDAGTGDGAVFEVHGDGGIGVFTHGFEEFLDG